MFGKAKVKRFNEEVNCAPAPNAYDAKLTQSKAGVALTKSQRFEESKYVTPGPGQYLVPSGLGIQGPSALPKPQLLARSSSFRVKKGSVTDMTGSSISSTPSATPRKLRRSVSSTNLSASKPTKNQDIQALEKRNQELQRQVEQLQQQHLEAAEQLKQQQLEAAQIQDSVVVKCSHEDTHLNNLREKLETVEAELETCRTELRYQKELWEEAQEERDKMLIKCEKLSEKSDRAESLSKEVELLVQDNSSLEEEISALQEERFQVESELEEMRSTRLELEDKCKEEDAKNIFLHFTQEQLNSQVTSLESVVTSLKQENTLLARGINKMVAAVQEEKAKNAEITDAYMKENADSEQEFNRLEQQLTGLKVLLEEKESLLLKVLRDVDNLQVKTNLLEGELAELNKELEVSDNDKTVLKDTLHVTEKEKNGLALDLAEISKNKMEVEEKLKKTVQTLESFKLELEETRGEVHEVEMTKLGLEGALASLREEITQMEVNLCQETDKLEQTNQRISVLQTRCTEQDSLLEENRDIISKLEEVNSLLQDKEKTLIDEISLLQLQVENLKNKEAEADDKIKEIKNNIEQLNDKLDAENILSKEKDEKIKDLETTIAEIKVRHEEGLKAAEDTREQLVQAQSAVALLEAKLKGLTKDLESTNGEKSTLEESLSKAEIQVLELENKIMELKVNREEIGDSLLDTQELVTCLESKLHEQFVQHKSEEDRLCGELRSAQGTLEQLKRERGNLIEINTSLSNQVSESLHAIANLQDREKTLGKQCQEYQVQVEVYEEEGERERMRLQEAEVEVFSLQAELESALTEIGEMEAEKIILRERFQFMVEELERTRTSSHRALEELRETKTVGRELYCRVQDLEKEQEKQDQELNIWKQRSHDQEQEVHLLRENVGHLEGLRDNLEINVSEKSDLLHELRDEMNRIRVEMDSNKSKLEEAIKNNLRLKGNLEVRQEDLRKLREMNEARDAEVAQLKVQEEQMRLREEELVTMVAGLEVQVEEKQMLVKNLTQDREEKEIIRMKEMEMLMNLRSEVEDQKSALQMMEEAAARGESAQRSMEAQQRLLCEAEAKSAASEEAVEQWRAKLLEAENMLQQLEERLEQLEQENKQLQEIIEPFRDQLESFEIEKNALLSQSEQAQDEVKKLATQYGKLLGHQNQKQKIQHVVKIKQENVELKTEISHLKETIAKNKKTISRLEDKLNEGVRRFDPRLSFQTPSRGGKENLMTPSKEGLPMTPMGPPKDLFNKSRNSSSRSSTSSPLKSKN
ncbi:hyaluronan mediated motility receptor [Eurytemora carolleeae]|uniref:hyaluronan mediated motility receptor n=1 Tax=Eurytemora carolleeae TaxID=1294199 RepID=UPI000C75C175|nr:hyaluronan mediated motility receptor [Eurytemora carolleeae]|eukprot:XP_023336551.1 hyaluronan mediated motility receptor-like [Eurytemora affinis]